MKQVCFGFGFMPDICQHHFYLEFPLSRSKDALVKVYERFAWDSPSQTEDTLSTSKSDVNILKLPTNKFIANAPQTIHKSDILKLELPKAKWNSLAGDITKEFNIRLKIENKPKGNFKLSTKNDSHGIPFEKLFGKELMVLLWAIEDIETRQIPVAIRNWQGLRPEERWWLYTMTNASTGEKDNKRGWRIALMYALSDNPFQDIPYIQAKLPFYN